MMNNVAGAGTFLDGAAVRLTGLHKNFGHIKAVRGVDLDIAPGEVALSSG
jgi:ABC-2 type transport system ATP-binding protein